MRTGLQISILLLIALCPFRSTAARDIAMHSRDSGLYKQHIRYVYHEHGKLQKHFKKLCKKALRDSASTVRYGKLYASYTQATSHFSYVKDKKSKAALQEQYAESQQHRGIIERTQQKLQSTNAADTRRLLACGKIKEATLLQKQAFYSRGKYEYAKKIKAARLLDRIGAKNIAALKEAQKFTSPVQAPAMPNAQGLSAMKLPKVQLPEYLQVNSEVNKAFQFDKPGKGFSKKEKLQNSISNPLQSIIDTTRLQDTLLFRPNPYRLLPLKERIKPGMNSTMGDLLTGGRRISYALNLQYLLTPAVKPVLAVAFGHSLVNRKGSFSADAVSWQVRMGVEVKAYKVLSLFLNYEQYYYYNTYKNESGTRPNDFVLGFTNDTGKKRLFKVWAGVKLHELASRYANPIVFRIGF